MHGSAIYCHAHPPQTIAIHSAPVMATILPAPLELELSDCETQSTSKCSAVDTVRLTVSACQALRKQFKDPSSPFYLAPGETGPSDADFPLPTGDSALKSAAFELEGHSQRQKAEQRALSHGFDPLSFWEQKICWGDLDSFR